MVTDAENRQMKLYPHVRHILTTLKLKNITAVAITRCPEVVLLRKMMKLLDLRQYFEELIVHPAPKLNHFYW